MSDPFAEHKEPEEVFHPLSAQKYAEFYATEMDGFTRDIAFYQKHCRTGSSVLELGCGSGRISRTLSSKGYSATGLDLSQAMLNQAMKHPANPPWYICMDMTCMAFRKPFDHILIPYNTLNLLRAPKAIRQCLQEVRRYLHPHGTLLLQIHIPDRELIELKGQKRFQFQMFPLQNTSGKLIKETLCSYLCKTETIHLEERYRLRPIGAAEKRADYSHTLHLAGLTVENWLDIFKECGFQDLALYGNYDSRPFQLGTDSTLLIKAFLSDHTT